MEKFHTGFLFEYNGFKVDLPEMIYEKEVNSIGVEKQNSDEIPLFVHCCKCNTFMDFHFGEYNNKDGYWICPECGDTVSEKTVYNQITKEGITLRRKMNNDEYWKSKRAC